MRIVTIGLVALVLGPLGAMSAQAQEGGLASLIESILQKIEELSGQVQDLREKFSAQTEQLTALKEQLDRLKPLAAQLAELQGRFEPLLDRWPEVEQALSTVRSVQSRLSGLQSALEELKRQAGAARSNPDPRVDALQAQLNALEQQLTERNEAVATLRGELKGLRTLTWSMLAAVLLLFLWQLGQLLTRRPQAASH